MRRYRAESINTVIYICVPQSGIGLVRNQRGEGGSVYVEHAGKVVTKKMVTQLETA